MRPLNLHIQGFKSFGNEVTFQFPEDPGLFLLLGTNRVERDLGANGAGKSTVFDALCWVLFGKTSRGTKGPGLINWSEDYLCQVILELDHDGALWELKRTQKPNALTLTNVETGEVEKKTQDEVDDFLGFRYDAFLSSILLGQFNPWFFDLTAAGRLQVLHDALDLGVYDRAAKLAGEKVKEAQTQLDRKTHRIATIRGEIKGGKSNLAVIRVLNKDWKTAHRKQVNQLDQDIEATEERVLDAKVGVARSERELEKVQAKIKTARDRMIKKDSKVRLASTKLAKYRALEKASRKTATEFEDQLDNLPQVGDECPTCTSVMDEDQRGKLVESLESAQTRALDEASRLSETVSTWRERLDRSRESLKTQDPVLDELERSERDLSKKLRSAQTYLGGQTSLLRRAKKEMALLELDTNPHTDSIRQVKASINALIRERKSLQAEVDHLESEVEVLSFWRTGMKEVRLVVVDEAIRQLEIHVNSALVSLGLRKWSITFDIERASATGKAVRGFTTMIESPKSGHPVPWELWSGGETQRLRIAGAMGISTLIRDRLGIESPLEVWDEPTAHLSDEGVDDLIQTLSERSRENGRTIWVIDHRSPNNGSWSGSRTIKKGSTGSYVSKGREL